MVLRDETPKTASRADSSTGARRRAPRGLLASRAVAQLDLDAYFGRLGLDGSASVEALHRRHAYGIPFENLDAYGGRPVRLDHEALSAKFGSPGRGGYCFEHNLVLLAALKALGLADVVPLLARVRRGEPPWARNHLLVSFRTDGVTRIGDVGFGATGLLEPIQLETGTEHDQDGWRFRLRADGDELVLQSVEDGAWIDEYGFVPTPVPLVDVEAANWYVSTHPSSYFVTGLAAGRRHPDTALGLRVEADGTATFHDRPPGLAATTTAVQLDDVPELLAMRFGIDGVRVQGTRLVVAPVVDVGRQSSATLRSAPAATS